MPGQGDPEGRAAPRADGQAVRPDREGPEPMKSIVEPKREDLSPYWQAVLADLEDRVDTLCRRLERARGRVRKVRALRRQVVALQAENERLRGLLEAKESSREGG